MLVQVIQAPVDSATNITDVDANNNCRFTPDPDSTPLMIACCNDNSQLVKLLLDHNADPNIENRRKYTALMYSSGNSKIYQMLLDSGANIDKVTNYGITTMHCACTSGDVRVVEKLLTRNHDLLYRVDRFGQTPLKVASVYGHLAIVGRLLQEKADPNIHGYKGRTPLMSASSTGHLAVVERLLQERVDPNIQDNEGWTSLMHASSHDHLAIVKRLLQQQADPNVQDNEGWTSLMYASRNGHLRIVQQLLQAKANPGVKSNSGHTALSTAIDNNHSEIVAILCEALDDINSVNTL